MTAPARKSAPVSNLDEHRLRKLLSDRRDRAARLAQDDERIAAFCRQWGDAHGYRMRLNAQQILRAMEKGEGR